MLNAANEVAVGAFLAGRIGFLDIVAAVESALAACDGLRAESLDDILAVDALARRRTETLIADRSPPRSGTA